MAVGRAFVENQQHRLTASAVTQPVGMKNPTSGDLNVMLNAIYAAQRGHVFAYQGHAVQTEGNPLAHACFARRSQPARIKPGNYHYEDLMRLSQMYLAREVVNPACLIDTNHANSNKQYAEQPRIAMEVLHSRAIVPRHPQAGQGPDG